MGVKLQFTLVDASVSKAPYSRSFNALIGNPEN